MARAHHTALPQDLNSQIAPPAPRTEARRGGAEPWLVTGGVLMMLFGVALVVLPTVFPQHAWLVHSLASRGVTSLPIAIGGVLLCGIAFAGRSNRGATAPSPDAVYERSQALESLGQQVASLDDGLQGIRIEFVYLKDALESQLERVQAATTSSAAGDAVYRLAASLDQVGLRIEERVNAGNRDLGESLRALSTMLEALREENTKLREQVEETARASTAAVTAAAETAAAAAAETAAAAAAATAASAASAAKAYSLDDADEGYADGWTPNQGQRSPQSDRLGLLDMLDDLGRLLPRKAAREQEEGLGIDLFEGSQDEGWKQSASIPSALPSFREDEVHLGERGQLLGRGMPHAQPPEVGGVLGDKLEELRDLLADARVREALAALERGRR